MYVSMEKSWTGLERAMRGRGITAGGMRNLNTNFLPLLILSLNIYY
jgi:hypothetical protein